MAYNYSKKRSHGGDDSFWTSYSDLFLGMSVIFLLLYVTASLRTGTDGFRSAMETKRLTTQVEDLQNQLKAYDSIRNQYLKQEATPDESQLYNELMDKLTLLQEDSQTERSKLQNAIREHSQKEKALNQYQQMVRNIINANVMSKTKIKTREDVIEDQDTEIESQTKAIVGLEQDVQTKTRQIEQTEEQLAKKLKELNNAYRSQKLSQAAYKAQVEKLKEDSQDRIDQLKSQIDQTESRISAKAAELEETKRMLGAESAKAQKLAGDLESEKKGAQALGQQVAQLGTVLKDKEGQVAQLGSELKDKEGKVAQLGSALKSKEGQVAKLGSELKDKEGKVAQLGGQLKDTEGLLAKARAEADARKQISKQIKQSFAKAGVKADVDDRTGEVILSFGDVYFDNDSPKLKPQMKEILKKAMPAYAKSLLGDNKISDKIASVEIIGFASPTYQGKYVDPNNLDPAARKAVDYNLDLSYARARSLFQFVFDEDNLRFDHQKQMLPLIKVTGRSFLAENLPRNPASKGGDFCQVHDCRKAQRVIIRFNFDDKK